MAVTLVKGISYLEGLLKPRPLGSTPRVSGSVNTWSSLRICISDKFIVGCEWTWSWTLNEFEDDVLSLGVLLYVGILVLIPRLFKKKKNPGNLGSYTLWEEMTILVIKKNKPKSAFILPNEWISILYPSNSSGNSLYPPSLKETALFWY